MKKLLILLVSASFVFVGMNTASAKRRGCYARYTVSGKTTPWYNLGRVGGFFKNKKKACLNRAKSFSNLRRARTYIKKTTALCGKKVKVWIDTEVDGKRNSRDGYGYLANGGYTCKRICTTSYKKAASCKLPSNLRVAAPYVLRGGYLYLSVRRCYWKIY